MHGWLIGAWHRVSGNQSLRAQQPCGDLHIFFSHWTVERLHPFSVSQIGPLLRQWLHTVTENELSHHGHSTHKHTWLLYHSDQGMGGYPWKHTRLIRSAPTGSPGCFCSVTRECMCHATYIHVTLPRAQGAGIIPRHVLCCFIKAASVQGRGWNWLDVKYLKL